MVFSLVVQIMPQGPAFVLGGEGANGNDSPVSHADIGKSFAGMVDEGRALDEEIEGFCQDAAR